MVEEWAILENLPAHPWIIINEVSNNSTMRLIYAIFFMFSREKKRYAYNTITIKTHIQ